MITELVTFWVEGVPQPQGSKTGFVAGGRAVVVDKNPKMLKPWRALVSATAANEMVFREAAEGALVVRLEFRFVRPASVKAEKRPWPSVRPDIDKLARSVLDSLKTGGVYKDDAQVVDLAATKVYADVPGVRVRVGRMEKHTTEKREQ
jgi:Holliday junction resolvase RusA-like endonuclease